VGVRNPKKEGTKMSDENTAAAPADVSAPNPVVANATQALAIKELGETVAGVKKQIKTIWIVVIVLAVVTVASAGLSLAPRLGLGMMGNRGTFQGGVNGAPSSSVPGQTPAQP
jgi:hypothetical protein